ncbi:MAG: glycosyltransferase 87 family protein [Myxococcales bacterium]
MSRSRYLRLAAIALLLGVSIPSYSLIPFHKFWGLDLHNLQAFHTCAARDNPYLATGQQCADDGWRDMYYPPALYFSFTWTRLCSLPTAIRIWAAVIVLGTLACLGAWLPRAGWRRVGWPEAATFCLMLAAQFPVVFAAERGNSDVIVLAQWTLAMVLMRANRPFTSGLAAGAAAATKLYPVFGCLVTGVGLVARGVGDRKELPRLLRYFAGGVAAVVLLVLAFLPQTRSYLDDELPRYARDVTPLFVYSHSLQHVFAQKELAYGLFALLAGVWTVAAARFLQRDPTFVFAGGLAIATYWASTSYDYNLLVTFPLLLLLFARGAGRDAVGARSWWAFALLLVGLFAIVGHRGLFAGSDTLKRAHILLQWGWLLAVGLAAPRLVDDPSPERAGAKHDLPAVGPGVTTP